MAKKLWGGRFDGKEIDPLVMKFTSSLDVDNVLAEYDCLSSIVQVEMLAKCGYLSKTEKRELVDVLEKLHEKIREGSWDYDGHEDIHSAVQSFVESKVPRSAKKLHTGRSRNEQVVNDVRLYCRDSINKICDKIVLLQKSFVNIASKNINVIVPGYTHLNRAQPVLFSHLILAYVEMLERDISRLMDASERLSVSVMGSGAIAGSALSLDRKYVCERLGLKMVSANSIDSVSDRDFMAEVISGISLIAVHLSRISEDFILYSIPEFGFLDMGSDYCTGSSLMPQKRNPDVLELIRGKTSLILGALNSIFVLLKGLPHSYNRDLQEDKKPLFESVELILIELEIMAALVKTIKMDKVKASSALENEFIYATDLAEYLVCKGISFKDAHDKVGQLVKSCSEKKINISDLSLAELKMFSKKLEDDVYSLLNSEVSIKNKKTTGSTNPKMVSKSVEKWMKKLGIKSKKKAKR